MANILGLITNNGKQYLEIDADPSAGLGTPAPIGSLATLQNGSIGSLWIKFGSNNTDWNKFNPDQKSGYALPTDFSGNPKRASVAFPTSFPSTNYSINIDGSNDVRSWTYENVTINGFIINSNANAPITGIVSWSAVLF